MIRDFFAAITGSIYPAMQDSTSLFVITLFAFVIVLLFIALFYLISHQRYYTNINDFFKRKMREMIRSHLVTKRDVMLVPVIHGKKTIIPLEKAELLHFYTLCHYYFFKLNEKIKNMNIDLLFTDKESINDFENIGRGRAFFTSKMVLFENIRSRNQILLDEVTEIKVKYGYLIVFDNVGCHVFAMENPEIIADFIYNIFLKEV
ncbi:hypothetical protein ACFL6D_03750 [Spirochaetota bacterium]